LGIGIALAVAQRDRRRSAADACRENVVADDGRISGASIADFHPFAKLDCADASAALEDIAVDDSIDTAGCDAGAVYQTEGHAHRVVEEKIILHQPARPRLQAI